ncbi:MAG: zinc ribbon domain-containing protein [Planctomycetota bacterium]
MARFDADLARKAEAAQQSKAEKEARAKPISAAPTIERPLATAPLQYHMACVFWLLVLALPVGVYLYGQHSKRALLRGLHKRYDDALSALDKDPANLSSRKEALKAGRSLAEMSRLLGGEGGRTIFDEAELQNDLSIRIGATSAAEDRSRSAPKKCHNCGARSDAGSSKCGYCGARLTTP